MPPSEGEGGRCPAPSRPPRAACCSRSGRSSRAWLRVAAAPSVVCTSQFFSRTGSASANWDAKESAFVGRIDFGTNDSRPRGPIFQAQSLTSDSQIARPGPVGRVDQSGFSYASLIGGILLMMYFAADSISGNSVLALMLMPSSSSSSFIFAEAGTFVRITSIPNLFDS